MCVRRGQVPPAIVTSTIVLILCAIAWGALGVLSIVDLGSIPTDTHRYLCVLLATVTICSGMVNLAARIVQVIRETRQTEAPTVCGYAEGYTEGYTEGVDAAPVSPAVSKLVRTPR